LRDEVFAMLSGNTDSEHVFALFVSQLTDANALYSAEQLAQVMENTIMLIQQLQRDAGVHEFSSMNFAVTDGMHGAILN
jgi:glutamine amidotransferase